MTKNGLAPEAAASDTHISKRQKLAPASEIESSSTALFPDSINQAAPENPPVKMTDQEISEVQPLADDEQARELKAGIEQYVNTEVNGFRGILKQRYTDFMVNEISLDGTVLHLLDDRAPNFSANNEDNQKPGHNGAQPALDTTNNADNAKEVSSQTDKPLVVEPEKAESVTNVASEAVTAEAKPSFTMSPEDDALLEDYFGTEFKEQIVEMHDKILSKPNAKPATFGSLLSEPFTDRQKRGKLHGDIRRIFKSRFETTLVDGGNIKFSAASRAVAASHGKKEVAPKHNQGGRGQRVNQAKGKLGWDELGGQYLHFTLFKENKDTMEVLSYLARMLRVKPKDFAFAGTKDRRAVTAQRVSVFRQHAQDLARLNPSIRQARIGDFKYEKYQLKLGDLNGNFFTITLRDCHFDGEDGLDESERIQLAQVVLENAIKHFQRNGFINYFGLQRFGTFSVSNDVVGAQILNGNFEAAVNSILHYNPALLHGDPNSTDRVGRDDIARARAIHEFQKTGQSRGVLDQMPKRFTAEQCIIRHLGNKNSRKDYIGALGMIQRNLKTMYVHAYQSLVWNAAASERWSRYGSKVIQGDLVIVESGESAMSKSAKEEFDENGEVIILPAEDDSALQANEKFERARPLSADEAASGKYSIFDIVLPTPGFDVEYPQNDVGNFYKDFMASERGGGLDPADMRRNQKDFSLSGNYRKLLSRADDLGFEIKQYHGETEQLTETDLEILDQKRPQARLKGEQRNNGNDWYNQRRGQNNQGTRSDFHAGSGKLNESQGDTGSRFTRDVRFEDPNFVNSKASSSSMTPAESLNDGTMERAAYAKVSRDAAAINAWNALPAQLEAEQSAITGPQQEAEKIIADGQNFAPSVAPAVHETYIQTGTASDGRREIISRSVTTSGVGSESQPQNDDTSNPSVPPAPVSTATTTIQAPTQESTVGDKIEVSAVNKLDSTTEHDVSFISSDSTGGVPLETPKIAVIIKFALGTSQYATMALRELLKAGGLTPYKPDFSTGR